MQNTILEMYLNVVAKVEFQIVVYHKARDPSAMPKQFASGGCSMKHCCIISILLSSLQFAVLGLYWKNASVRMLYVCIPTWLLKVCDARAR